MPRGQARNFTARLPTPGPWKTLGGNLFGSTGSGNTVGIYLIDPSGTAPATGATPYVTTGTSSDHSPYEFALFNDTTNQYNSDGYNVAYIADDKTPSGDTSGGIEKWTYSMGVWTQAYILKDPAVTGYRGLAGELDATAGTVTLFATDATGTKLQQVTDTGAGSLFTTLATLPANYAFRGVALVPVPTPEPSTLALLAAGAMGLLAYAWRRRRSA